MLKVSSAQLDALAAGRLHAFCVELAARARLRHGATCDAWTDAELVGLLTDEITFARGHGIVRRDVLERWADLAILLGFGFGAALPWAAAILAEDVAAPLRLDRIEREAVFAAREA